MKKLRLKLDYLAGPIWHPYYNEATGLSSTGIAAIDRDPVLKNLNDKAQDLYASYFEFNTEEAAVAFNHARARETKTDMLHFLADIKKRIAELNDGSIQIIDEATEEVENF